MMTAQDIEIAVARHFGFRANLIVPNVSWGWGLRHEADLLVLRPSGLCDEVEIKVTASDIRADRAKRESHWEDPRIASVWFAVPAALAGCPDIPAAAGVLSVSRSVRYRDAQGRPAWRQWQPGDAAWSDRVEVVKVAKLRPKAERRLVSDKDRVKLAELAAMRIWALKERLAGERRAVKDSMEGGAK